MSCPDLLMIMFMVLMMMTAAALMVMPVVLMMMATTTLMVMLVMLMMMTAAAFMVMVLMVVMMPVFCRPLSVSGIDQHFPFHCPGNFDQFRNQSIRIFRCQPQLLGRKGNDRFLHSLMIVEFLLNLGSTVGAVQIVNDVYFSGHLGSSFMF